MGRNVFEKNEFPDNEKDIEVLGGEGPAFVLPSLEDGHEYKLKKLPSGKVAVLTEEQSDAIEKTCDCGPYQGCATCSRYQGDDLDSPESRTLRHRD